jgi:serine/threonine-protein kinase
VADLVHDVQAGVVLSRRYRLERRLGSGATAAVWQARDLDLGRAVAIKLFLGDDVPDELAARFEREGMILGRLSHPNVVTVYSTGTHEGRPYLVMELVDGEPLTRVLARGPMDIERAVELLAAISAGLAAAHRAGVVHRDVKPANILCSEGGMPRLVDFGIARAPDLTSVTGGDLVVGTAAYLSPEQARGETPGPASDVYSLGCVLYEALTGRPPFDADTAVAVAYRHVHDEPESPRAHRSEIPDRVAMIVERCLAKDPARRYRDAAALEAALRDAAPDENDDATTTVAIAPVRDTTMVMPAVDSSDDLIDATPLAPVDEPRRPWGLIGAIGAVAVVLLVLALSLAGSDADDRPGATTDSSDVPRSSIVTTTTTPTTIAPAGETGHGHGNGKGKRGRD